MRRTPIHPPVPFFFMASALLALAACGPVAGPDSDFVGLLDGRPGVDSGTDGPTADADTGLVGSVRTPAGEPVGGVTVRIAGRQVTTSSSGWFVLEGVPEGRHTATFSKFGWSTSYRPVSIVDGEPTIVSQVLVVADVAGSFPAGVGAEVDVEAGAKVTLPSGTYQTDDGTPYTGAVHYTATVWDLGTDEELKAAPGTFAARDVSGDNVTLESFGMIQVDLTTADGVDLQLPSGSTSRIVMPLQTRGTELPAVGTMVPAWYFDEDESRWIGEGAGVVVTLPDGRPGWQFDAPHYTPWNVDLPADTRQCVSGRVVDSLGEPIPNATIEAIGEDFISTTTTRANAEGQFCVAVMRGGTVNLEISFVDGGEVVTHKTQPVTTSGDAAACAAGFSATEDVDFQGEAPQGDDDDVEINGDCTDMGEIVAIARTCVQGILMGPDSQPVAGQRIFSPEQGNVETDENGGFCMQFRAEQEVSFYVLAGLEDDTIWQPVRTSPAPANQGCNEGCPNTVTFIPYPQVACVEGQVKVDGQAPGVDGQVLVQVYDNAFEAAPVYNAKVAADGTYCAQVPANTDVDVVVGPEDEPCGGESMNLEATAGVCDLDASSQSGESCEHMDLVQCTTGDDDDSTGDDDDSTGDDDDSAGDDDDSTPDNSGQDGQGEGSAQ